MSLDAGEGAEAPEQLLAGRYRLVAPIGRGGMGAVWHAVDEVLGRDVAVKAMALPHTLPDDERNTLRERALREARIAARLRHPSLVTVHDVVTERDNPHIVMELVQSRSLQDVVAEDGPLPPREVAEIGVALVDALRTAHAAGVLHRDVKPSNVLLGEDGRVVLTDFGVARLEGDPKLTLTGQLMGSPGYVAPEIAQGVTAATPASDLWSLGATLYTAVEGRQAYDRDSFFEVLSATAKEDPDPVRLAGPLEPVLAGLLRRDLAARLDADRAERMLRDILRTETGPRPLAAAAGRTAGPPGSGSAVAGVSDRSTAGRGSVPSGSQSRVYRAGGRRRRSLATLGLVVLAVAVIAVLGIASLA
jgi:eukaryotic-like serine/threonine-protein kinase